MEKSTARDIAARTSTDHIHILDTKGIKRIKGNIVIW